MFIVSFLWSRFFQFASAATMYLFFKDIKPPEEEKYWEGLTE